MASYGINFVQTFSKFIEIISEYSRSYHFKRQGKDNVAVQSVLYLL